MKTIENKFQEKFENVCGRSSILKFVPLYSLMLTKRKIFVKKNMKKTNFFQKFKKVRAYGPEQQQKFEEI